MTDMTRSIRASGDGSFRSPGTITPHRFDQLDPVGNSDTTDVLFGLLYDPPPQLRNGRAGEGDAELTFVVKDRPSSHPYTIWTPGGHREAVSRETWRIVFKPRWQNVVVPTEARRRVKDAWRQGEDVSAVLDDVHPSAWISAEAGEGTGR